MKKVPFAAVCLWWLIAPAGFVAAQTPVVPSPVVRPPIVTRAIAPPRVVEVAPVVPPATITARPVVREAVVRETAVAPARSVTWWDAFGKLRYGFYDDGFTDDNWFYDYYEMPPATVAVEQPVIDTAGIRTSWRYDPLVEQRLFRW